MSGPTECSTCFPTGCPPQCFHIFTPPVYRLPPPFPLPKRSSHHLSVLTIVAIVVSSFFLLLCFLRALSRSRRSARNTSFARAIPRPDSNYEEAAQDSGLDQRVINSIVMFNYKRGDGLVQVTECSVCLNEFREQETLRLLPNCTHAFHPDCIDTWLESHVNCPLCRSSIVEDEPPPQSSSIGSNRGYSGAAGRNHTGNLDRSAEAGENRRVEAANDRTSARADFGVSNGGNGAARTEGAREMRPPESNRGFPAQFDLGDNRRSGECAITVMDDATTPRARISFSIEQSSSSTMHNSLDNWLCRDPGGSSTDASSLLNAGDRKSKQHRQNQNRCRMMGNCSKRSSLHTRPVSMKRSSSTGRMVGSPRHGRRDNHRLLL